MGDISLVSFNGILDYSFFFEKKILSITVRILIDKVGIRIHLVTNINSHVDCTS